MPNTYLLAWNPKHFRWDELPELVRQVDAGQPAQARWSCGHNQSIEPGDRFYMVRVGVEPRGLIGRGRITSGVEVGPHWDDPGKEAHYIQVEFTSLLDPAVYAPLPPSLLDSAPLNEQHWWPQSGGISIQEAAVPHLDAFWQEHERARQPVGSQLQGLNLRRASGPHCHQVWAALTPDADLRRLQMEVAARVVREANKVNPMAWTAAMGKQERRIGVNSGVVIGFRVRRDSIAIPLVNAVADEAHAKFGIDEEPYRLTRLEGHSIIDIRPEALPDFLEEFAEEHLQAVRADAAGVRASSYRRAHAPGVLEAIESVLGEELPRPTWPPPSDRSAASSDELDIDHVVGLVQRRYEGWEDCAHPAFHEDEIAYKRETERKAAEILAKQPLLELLDAGEHDEILDRFKRVAEDNNLLYQSVPGKGDLAILYHEPLDRPELSRRLVRLLHGEGSAADRVSEFSDWANANELPNKWTFATYHLFFQDPARNILVKPRQIDAALKLLGANVKRPLVPTGDSYREILEVLGRVAEELELEDFIELQSILYVAYHQARRERLAPARREELEALFDEFIKNFPDTGDGQYHRGLVLESARAIQENFADIRAKADAGEDITDEVLLRLLPHRDTEGNRERGAWISVAPVINKDIKSWFESVGRVQEGQWPQVARLLWDFFRQCMDDPGSLDDACQDFARSPHSKGFGMGTLSTSLSSLAPDRFVNANSKPRVVHEYFTAEGFSGGVEEYPDFRDAFLDLQEELADFLDDRLIEGLNRQQTFDTFCHWLVAVKQHPLDVSYYKMSPGERAERWPRWRDQGYVAIGWGEFGDLSSCSKAEFSRRQAGLVEKYDDWTKNGTNQVWEFSQMKEGDIVLANRGTREVLGVGRITGPYYFAESTDEDEFGEVYNHRFPVDWFDKEPKKVEQSGWRRTLVKLKPEVAMDIMRLGRPRGTTPPVPAPAQPKPSEPDDRAPQYPLRDLVEETGFDQGAVERWLRALERKGQAVFYGPPGTGKTYVALHLARHLIGGGTGFYELLQFHPSYAYEDFIQGIRPQTRSDGTLHYSMVQGSFYDFCRRAEGCGDDPCVLIIDEINRANLSRVFGELMYLLEYRDSTLSLAGGGEKFSIPENVRIIGTMNTADRSIALVDHALRRRFAFLPLQPDYELLLRKQRAVSFTPRLVELLREVNQKIQDPHYHIGITYFLGGNLEEEIDDIWQMEIYPYLSELFFNQPEAAEEFHWERVRGRLEP